MRWLDPWDDKISRRTSGIPIAMNSSANGFMVAIVVRPAGVVKA